MEESLYIIKPHGMIFREKIRVIIEQAGLSVKETKEVVLPRWALDVIYSDLHEKFRDAVFRQFKDARVEMGLVIGKNAVNRLLEIVGYELDPADCAPGSIRCEFGTPESYMIDGVRCYKNVIHRPRNTEEAKKDIRVFRIL